MSKSILLALVSVASVAIAFENADARCCRNRCGRVSRCQTSCAPVCSASITYVSAPIYTSAPACQSCSASINSTTPVAVASSAMQPEPIISSSTNSSSNSYESYSYEPDASRQVTPVAASVIPTPVYVSQPMATSSVMPANRTYRQPSTTFYDSVRGDRKIRGLQ